MSEIAKIPAQNHPITPMEMLSRAVDQGADLDKLTKLMDLQDRWEANNARKDYVAAMAAFKKDPPKITKDKTVGFGKTSYSHASHNQVCEKIAEALSAHDMTHSWDVHQLEGGMIKITCTITHVGGHSESVSMQSSADTSGSKNNIQAIGSAVTYLQRYTLLSITGLGAAEKDDDGHNTDGEKINAEQLAAIRTLIDETQTDVPRFCAYLQIDALPDMTTKQFINALAALKKKQVAK